MKQLAKGERRFIPKKVDRLFRVYDRANGSFPYRTPELGQVTQDVTEAEAQAEADRLNEEHVGKIIERKTAPVSKKQKELPAAPSKTIELGDLPPTSLGRKAKASKKPSGPPPSDETPLFKEAEWVDESEIGDYGDLEDQTEGYVDWK